MRPLWNPLFLSDIYNVSSRSLFHDDDEDVVGFEGDLNDLDMDAADEEYVQPSNLSSAFADCCYVRSAMTS